MHPMELHTEALPADLAILTGGRNERSLTTKRVSIFGALEVSFVDKRSKMTHKKTMNMKAAMRICDTCIVLMYPYRSWNQDAAKIPL
jgi:hypothetical protein